MESSQFAAPPSARRHGERFAPYAPGFVRATEDELDAAADAAIANLASVDGSLPVQVGTYLSEHRAWPSGWAYNRVPAPVQATVADVRERGGAALLGAFHRAAICAGLCETRRRLVAHDRWPHSLPYFDDAASRILAALPVTPDAELDYGHDKFAKDMALATGRMWHAKAQLVGPRLGIARSRIANSGIATIGRAAALLTRLGGHAPLYEMHTYRNLLHWFNEEGWADCYRAIAEALLHDPVAKGVYSTAWYFDPVLSEVSPRLSYLRRFPAERGAVFLKVTTSAMGIGCALSKSESRRKLYEQGSYRPQEYLLVWPRAAMLSWLRAGGC